MCASSQPLYPRNWLAKTVLQGHDVDIAINETRLGSTGMPNARSTAHFPTAPI